MNNDTCPICDWKYSIINSRHYQVDEEGIVYDCDKGIHGNPIEVLKGKEIYPIIHDFWKSDFDRYSWREIHLCPTCQKEFEFMNGYQG